MRLLLFISTALLLFSACKTKQKALRTIELSAKHQFILADSLAATNFITNDVHDDLFAKITEADMSIQTKKALQPGTSRHDYLEAYFLYLQKDVRSFKKEEAAFVEKCIRNAYKMCNTVSADIFPKELKLIKVKGNHYGDGAYYTREDCIVIPANELAVPDEAKFTETMLHEIFHIYSRFHKDHRMQLYDLIGFHPLENPDIIIPKQLQSKILLNPDGTNYTYAIDIQLTPDNTVKVIPILYTTTNGYQNDNKPFFQYLRFGLFKVQRVGRGYELICNEDGSSTIDTRKIPDFYRQIRDNTNYIIHPDEILADNFMYMVLTANGKEPKKFSAEGKQLLNKIKVSFNKN